MHMHYVVSIKNFTVIINVHSGCWRMSHSKAQETQILIYSLISTSRQHTHVHKCIRALWQIDIAMTKNACRIDSSDALHSQLHLHDNINNNKNLLQTVFVTFYRKRTLVHCTEMSMTNISITQNRKIFCFVSQIYTCSQHFSVDISHLIAIERCMWWLSVRGHSIGLKCSKMQFANVCTRRPICSQFVHQQKN